jgi:hypothetical protein
VLDRIGIGTLVGLGSGNEVGWDEAGCHPVSFPKSHSKSPQTIFCLLTQQNHPATFIAYFKPAHVFFLADMEPVLALLLLT